MQLQVIFRRSLRTVAFGLLVLILPQGCTTMKPPEQPAAAARSSSLANDMIGAWVHVGRPGSISEPPEKGARFKFRTGKHWTLTRADPDTGLVLEHFGGSYTLQGDEYVETQDYGDETWKKDNGKSFKFIVRVEGDTMTQFGVDNPYTEVWKRAK